MMGIECASTPAAEEGQYLGLDLLVRVLEASSDAVEIDDIDGNIVYVNDAWCQLFGLDRKEVTDQRWDSLQVFSPHESNELEDTWQTVFKEGRSQGTFSVTHADSRIKSISYGRTLYRNAEGLETAVITIYRPIRGAAYEPSPLLIALLKRRYNGVVVLDPDGRIVAANATFSRLVGHSEHQIVGLDVRSLVPIVEEALASDSDGITWWSGNAEVLDKDGGSLQVWLSVNAARASKGNIVGFVVHTSPIGGQEAGDEERRLVHDMRNKLTGVLVNVDVITRRDIGDEAIRDRLARINIAASEAMDILERMATDSGI